MSDENKNDGGPAFVVSGAYRVADDMSLRDYFAAHAPDPGLTLEDAADILNEGIPEGDPAAFMSLAVRARTKAAYMYADAMLKARGDG